MKELSTTSFGEDRGGTTGANFTFLLSPPASYKPTDNQTDTEYNVKKHPFNCRISHTLDTPENRTL